MVRLRKIPIQKIDKLLPVPFVYFCLDGDFVDDDIQFRPFFQKPVDLFRILFPEEGPEEGCHFRFDVDGFIIDIARAQEILKFLDLVDLCFQGLEFLPCFAESFRAHPREER